MGPRGPTLGFFRNCKKKLSLGLAIRHGCTVATDTPPMNFAALVVLTVMNRESWADAVEKQDDTLRPLPLAWVQAANESVKVWQEPEWTTVEHKKRPKRVVNNKPLGKRA